MVSDEVLDDDVCHVVSVGVAVFVQAVHSAEHQLVVGQSSILTAHCLLLHQTRGTSLLHFVRNTHFVFSVHRLLENLNFNVIW